MWSVIGGGCDGLREEETRFREIEIWADARMSSWRE